MELSPVIFSGVTFSGGRCPPDPPTFLWIIRNRPCNSFLSIPLHLLEKLCHSSLFARDTNNEKKNHHAMNITFSSFKTHERPLFSCSNDKNCLASGRRCPPDPPPPPSSLQIIFMSTPFNNISLVHAQVCIGPSLQ